jgi:hypothetical protein
LKNEPYTNQNKDNAVSQTLSTLKKRQYAEIKIDKKRHAEEDIPMHEPPNTKDIPCATIKSHLQAPTIQTGQTRENNITVKKMLQKKSLANQL